MRFIHIQETKLLMVHPEDTRPLTLAETRSIAGFSFYRASAGVPQFRKNQVVKCRSKFYTVQSQVKNHLLVSELLYKDGGYEHGYCDVVLASDCEAIHDLPKNQAQMEQCAASALFHQSRGSYDADAKDANKLDEQLKTDKCGGHPYAEAAVQSDADKSVSEAAGEWLAKSSYTQ